MDDTPEYAPVSRLAVAALLVGCCAGLAVFSTICWAIPLVGIALSVAALADVQRPGGRKAGGLAALAGLALSVGFGAQAVSAAAVSRWVAGQRAQATAVAWLEAVRGDRLADAVALADRGGGLTAPPDETRAVEALAAQALVKAVQACPPTARLSGVTTRPDERGDGSWLVRGSLQPDAAGQGDAVTVKIVVAPQTVRRHRGSVERWGVVAFDLER
jgi:hypothetical protein